jgi:tetratricopeptide (TPR) repeat protein
MRPAYHAPLQEKMTGLGSTTAPAAARTLVATWTGRIVEVQKFLVSLAICTVVLLGVIAIVKEVRHSTYIIEPFNLPRKLIELGYSGEVAAQRLWNALEEIERDVQSIKSQNHFTTRSEKIDIVLPDATVSIQSAARFLKRMMGQEDPRVVGDVVCLDSDCLHPHMRIRILDGNNRHFEFERLTFYGLNRTFRDAALRIVEHIDAYRAAVYLLDRQPFRGREIAERLALVAGPNQAWGRMYLGNHELELRLDHEAAIRHYDSALMIEPDLSIARLNRANAYIAMARSSGNRTSAQDHLDRAASDIDAGSARSAQPAAFQRMLANWHLARASIPALGLSEKERHAELAAALAAFRRAVNIDPASVTVRTAFSEFLLNQRRTLERTRLIDGHIGDKAFHHAAVAAAGPAPSARAIGGLCRAAIEASNPFRAEDCLKMFDQHYERSNEDPTFLYHKARFVWSVQQEYAAAVDIGREAMKGSPSRAYFLAWMAADGISAERKRLSANPSGQQDLPRLTGACTSYRILRTTPLPQRILARNLELYPILDQNLPEQHCANIPYTTSGP